MLEFKIHRRRVDPTCGAETAQVCTEISEPSCPHGISQSTPHNRIYSYCVSHKRSSLVSQKAQEIILCFRRAAEYVMWKFPVVQVSSFVHSREAGEVQAAGMPRSIV